MKVNVTKVFSLDIHLEGEEAELLYKMVGQIGNYDDGCYTLGPSEELVGLREKLTDPLYDAIWQALGDTE